MYCIELAIKLSPLPLIVQRKRSEDAQKLYSEVIEFIKQGNQKFLEITCEKVEGKRLSFLVSEILAIQIYEKTAASSGVKRPGFSFDT